MEDPRENREVQTPTATDNQIEEAGSKSEVRELVRSAKSTQSEKKKLAKTIKARRSRRLNFAKLAEVVFDEESDGEIETVQSSEDKHALLGEVEVQSVPRSITHAYQSQEAPHWREAVLDEMHSINTNQVLSEPMELPVGKQATPTRMLFVRKYNSFGSVDRYKARLVYSYLWFKNKIDWGQLFAPVIDKVSIRIFWAMCASRQYHIEQVDVITAFLYGKCKQEVFITLPKELQSPEELQEGMVRKMQKSLYGTPDAPKIWYSTIAEYRRKLGFEKSKREQCLFQNATTKVMIMICG